MKLLLIQLDGATPERLFSDERLENIRRLMEWGSYGVLRQTAPGAATSWSALGGAGGDVPPRPFWDILATHGLQSTVIDAARRDSFGALIQKSEEQLKLACRVIRESTSDLVAVIDSGLCSLACEPEPTVDPLETYYARIDEGIGKMLQSVSGDSAIMIIGSDGSLPGGFVLAGPSCPMAGERQDVNVEDIAPTILAILGLAASASILDQTRDRESPALTLEEEEIFRQRLVGLGYVE
jgi:predicted AlkP superfamily phosphohydrolase/phosphomutase